MHKILVVYNFKHGNHLDPFDIEYIFQDKRYSVLYKSYKQLIIRYAKSSNVRVQHIERAFYRIYYYGFNNEGLPFIFYTLLITSVDKYRRLLYSLEFNLNFIQSPRNFT